MAWKLRKDKLKAGAPEAGAPTETNVTPESTPVDQSTPVEMEQSPVFDLSGSAFQAQPAAAPEEVPELPSFPDDPPIVLAPEVVQTHAPEPEPIALEPLPDAHARVITVAEPSFEADPLPEFDPIVAPGFSLEPEAIAPPPAVPEVEPVDPVTLSTEDTQDLGTAFRIAPEREAIAPGLVTTETETGLPRVAPFILDAPPAQAAPEAPRMHSIVIRIGKLSATHFLTKDVTTIGRPDSEVQNYPDIEIELDDGVSRRHAEIRRDGTGQTIVDVGSTNGTALNGEMLTPDQPAALRTGDRIRVGERTELLFE